jgi:hypothetical protein
VVASVVAFMDVSPLKEADRAKNRFLSLLSHELRTPLTNILGWAKESQDVPEVVPDALRIIRRNAEVQRRMLENLLEVSRLLYGKFTLQRERFDLWQLANHVIQTMAPEAEERRVTVETIPPEASLPVFADKKRMTEVIENILENALQPMLAAGIDTVVMGCTHYPFVIPLVQQIAGPGVRVIDPAPAVARQVGRLLRERGLANPAATPGGSPPDHRRPRFHAIDAAHLDRGKASRREGRSRLDWFQTQQASRTVLAPGLTSPRPRESRRAALE